MNTNIQQSQKFFNQAKNDQSPKGIMKVFRTVCVILFLILIFCVPGFLRFRHYCQVKDYYVFSVDSFKWCTLGFFLIFVIIYLCRRLSIHTLAAWLNPSSGYSILSMMQKLNQRKYSLCSNSAMIQYFILLPLWLLT